MRVLMLSIDSQILKEGAAARKRIADYGSLGDELHVVVYNSVRGEEERCEKEQIAPSVWVYPTNTRYRPLYYIDGLRIAIPLLKKEGEWVITSQEAMTNILALFLRIRFWRVPIHVQVHADFLSPYFGRGLRVFLQRAGYWIGIKLASHIRVVSVRIKRSLVSRYGVLPARVSVLPIFVDIGRIKEARAQVDFAERYPEHDFFVVTVARLEPEKNVALALEAFGKVAKKYPKAKLLVVGDGSLKNDLERVARRAQLGNNLVFVGSVEDVAPYYAAADAYLQTSNFEGFGLALAEAAAAGLPIVTTDVGLVGDILTKDSALICTPHDAECIKRNILFLYENKPMRRALGDSARDAVSRKLIRDYRRYVAEWRSTTAKVIHR